MNLTLSLNHRTHKLEMKYYETFSSNRYEHTENKNFMILTPFSKEYIHHDDTSDGGVLEYPTFIKEMVDQTLKIKRFDVLSYYHDHNNSPSVRSMHTARLLFVMNRVFYYYSMYDDQLVQVSEKIPEETIFKEDCLYIVGISDVLNLTRFYREFSLYATYLDAGHLLYNVKNVLIRHKKSFYEYKEMNSNYIYNFLNIDSRYTYIPFVLELKTIKDDSVIRENFIRGTDKRIINQHNELKPTTYIKDILKCYNESTVSNKRYVTTDSIPYFPLSAKLTRNSAHTTVGNNNFGEQFDDFIVEDILSHLSKSKRLFSKNAMEYCFIKKTAKGEYIYKPDFTITRNKIDFRLIMHNDHQFFDLNSYSIVFLCFSNKNAIPKKGLKNHLISSAEMMQAVALYASSVGYAFRPMKNHNDSYLKEILSLDDNYEINFMGVVCNSPIQQLSYFIE